LRNRVLCNVWATIQHPNPPAVYTRAFLTASISYQIFTYWGIWMELAELRRQLHLFAEARDWQPFHTPKNLAASVAIEAAELLECFQWLDDDQAKNIGSQPKKIEEVRDELADVLIYLVHLADVLDIDLAEAAANKIMRNELRFPPKMHRVH
jgi:dCTP diphosphatase